MEQKPPTLDDLRKQYERSKEPPPSRYHRSACLICGKMVTNNSLGRQAHMRMHKHRKILDSTTETTG